MYAAIDSSKPQNSYTADLRILAAESREALRKQLNAFCELHSSHLASMDDIEKDSFFAVMGHCAQVLNALIGAGLESSNLAANDHLSLVIEGQDLASWLGEQMKGVLQ